MEIQNVIFGLVGGLALFIYGMLLLSGGLQKIAGDQMKRAMEMFTKSPLRGVATGLVVTSIIQSSSVTTVTLVGLINAGLVSLEQTVGIILGADIGTTVTAQLVAFKVGIYALPIVAIGFLLSFLAKNRTLRYTGETILGFGVLFLGMNVMSEGVAPLKNSPIFTNLAVSFGKDPLLGILAGTGFTAIIQSSSATSGLVIAMAMQGLLKLDAAVALMLGANIGTCATALLASIGSSISGKRAAVVHLLFKVFGVMLIFSPLPYFLKLAAATSNSLPRQIANAHTLFNIGLTLVFLPLGFLVVELAKKIIPGEVIELDRGVKFIDKKYMQIPTVAASQANNEVVRMAGIALEMLRESFKIFFNNGNKLIDIVFRKEAIVDELHRRLDSYLTELSEKPLSSSDAKRVSGLLHAVTDIERVGDHINNIVEIASEKIKKKVPFSDEAMRDLREMFERVENVFSDAIRLLQGEDKELIESVLKQEKDIDVLEKKFVAGHMVRLETGTCLPHAGVFFVDLLRNLERIGDHSDNIAHMVLTGF